MKKNLFFGLLLCFIAIFPEAFSQILAEGRWHRGRVVDTEDNVYGGNIKYDTQRQTVMVDLSGSIRTFSARNVKFFEFYDEKVKATRRFYSLKYAKNQNVQYESLQFFELITQAQKVTLLGTEYLETRANPQPGWGWYGMGATTFSYRIVSEFYLMNNSNAKIIKLNTRKKKKFLQQMNEPRLEAFIKKNHLNINQRIDMVRIIEYYDSLQ
ncbi:MAG: hypothetical protein OHK0045_12070 [Raineya sp.]